jgi:hypothetical protein
MTIRVKNILHGLFSRNINIFIIIYIKKKPDTMNLCYVVSSLFFEHVVFKNFLSMFLFEFLD